MNRMLMVAAAIALVACGGGSGGTGGSGGSGGGGNGASSSVPSGFSKCPQSGDAASISDQDTKGEWGYQSKHGATSGNIEVYAASSGDCEGMPDIRPGSKRIIASAVITYKDAASASAAFNGGVFGVSHSAVAGASGAVTGTATGFGSDSVYAYSSGESDAMWLSGTKVTAVVGQNLSESDFKAYAQSLK